nr:hypothetical protein CFP56_59928 [Quercus suber]
MGNMSFVEDIVMAKNHFEDPISTELCKLVDLRFLDLSDNNLFGSIPSCFNSTSIRHKTRVIYKKLLEQTDRNIGPPTQKISLKPNGRPVKYLPKQDQQLSADGIQLLQDQQVAVREIYEIVPARKWKGEENQMTKIVFIGHNLNEDVLNDSFRTCMTPDAAEGGETDGVKKEANGHHSHGPLDSKNDELTSGQEDQALVGLGTGLASLDAKKQKAKGKAAA